MKEAHLRDGALPYEERIRNLEKLERLLIKNRELIAETMSADFRHRSRLESIQADIFVPVMGIRYIKEHLRDWMRRDPREVSILFFPGRAEVHYEPLGVVGIMAPWNYPVQLVAAPLAGALAAGNRALIKPSELTPRTSDLLAKLLGETFPADLVRVVNGGLDVAGQFSRLPFDHLVFTGSTRVGKIVMAAAAENLVPLTLELGGKSPTIIGPSAPLGEAATRIMSGKLRNAGQTCIAPDYALVHRSKVDAFVAACQSAAATMYPTLNQNPDYTSIVNDAQLRRLEGYLREAEAGGARVLRINPANETLDASRGRFAPALVLDAKDDMAVMQEEIFGPILPVVPYDSIDEAIAYVNARPKPLALYCFERNDAFIERVLERTSAGGVTVNDTILHVVQEDMPFGGVGASGMGHYHGHEGFLQLSKVKPIFHQSRFAGTSLFNPPYGRFIETMLKLILGRG
jgi:acyl-CoA reductase-like NAD-dependent aldehyde dehydrogenase